MTTIREEPIDQDAALTSAQHNIRRQPLDERGSDPAQHSGEVTLAIEYVPPASLAGYQRNARRHSKRQIAQIAESIRAFGFVSPLLVDKAGEIIAGHGRLAAARQLGRATVPVVRIEHLDEAQKRALRLADNKLAELAGWDETLLALEFSDLLELDLTLDLSFDLAVTGFTSPEIDRLVDRGAASTSSSTRDDEVPARDAERPPVSRLGDVWILGEHRICCGDARDAGYLCEAARRGARHHGNPRFAIRRADIRSRGKAWPASRVCRRVGRTRRRVRPLPDSLPRPGSHLLPSGCHPVRLHGLAAHDGDAHRRPRGGPGAQEPVRLEQGVGGDGLVLSLPARTDLRLQGAEWAGSQQRPTRQIWPDQNECVGLSGRGRAQKGARTAPDAEACRARCGCDPGCFAPQ